MILKFNQTIAFFVTSLLLAVLAHQTSKTLWALYYPVTPSILTDQTQKQSTSEDSIDYSQLRNFALFGTPPVKPVAPPPKKVEKVVKKKPVITLSVIGIVSYGDIFFAIIRHSGLEETYGIGEYVGRLLVENIEKDTIYIVDTDGEKYTLFLNQNNVEIGGEPPAPLPTDAKPEETSATPETQDNTPKAENTNNVVKKTPEGSANTPAVKTVKVNKAQKEKLLSFKKIMATNPLQMLGKITFVPYREDGKLIGFQVSPGTEKDLFFALQLRPGDIVTNINGQNLSAISSFKVGVEFMNKLSSQNVLNMILRRQGNQENIVIHLNS